MRYDFETVIDRSSCGSEKWEAMKKRNPNVGADIVPMSVADMEFMTAPEIREGLKRYIDTVIQGYTGPTQAYFDAVLRWQRTRHGYEGKKEWIVTTSGVVPAFTMLAQLLTEPGDGVIIQQPVYYPFAMAPRLTGRKLVNNPLLRKGDTYEIDFEDLEEKVKDPRNKVLIFCNPHNPIGKCWSREELTHLTELCAAHDVFIIDDEIHNDLIMPGCQHTALPTVSPEAARNCAYCTAPSKTFNLAGMQISNIFIEDPNLRRKLQMARMATMSTSQVSVSYEACRLAYDRGAPWLEELISVVDGNARYVRSFLEEHLPQAKVYPLEGTYLLWVDFRGLGLTHKELERMMLDADLYLDEGALFGQAGRGFERFNLALPRPALEKAMERLLRGWQNVQAGWEKNGRPEHITLEAGREMPGFTFDAPTARGLNFREETGGRPAVLLFHRYITCPVCGKSLKTLAEAYRALEAAGVGLWVVLQSKPETVRDRLAGDGALPFVIICDPERKLYDRFNIFSADSDFELLGGNVQEAMAEMLFRDGGEQAAPEGEPNQLPAWIAVDARGIIRRVHYGESIWDVPTAEQMLEALV